MCMRVGAPGEPATLGSRITTAVCDASDPAQSLVWDPESGRITHKGYCLDAGAVGRVIASTDNGASWTSSRITAMPCPDAGNPPLIPRSVLNGYTVAGATFNGSTRLIILDGEEYVSGGLDALGNQRPRPCPRPRPRSHARARASGQRRFHFR